MWLLAAILAMMLGFGFTLGVWFPQIMTLLAVFFLPWQDLGRRLARSRRGRHLTVLYDGACGLCARTIAVIRSLDVLDRVHVFDVAADEAQLATRFPSLNAAGLPGDHARRRRGGQVATGLPCLSGPRLVAPAWAGRSCRFVYLPGVPFCRRAGVRVIARSPPPRALPAPDASNDPFPEVLDDRSERAWRA